MNKPNILFIVIDGVRPDYLSCNNPKSLAKTPNIDKLAKEGANFRNCITAYPATYESMGTILTGTYPYINKSGTQQFDERNYTLVQKVEDAGYQIASFFNQPPLVGTSDRYEKRWNVQESWSSPQAESPGVILKWLAEKWDRKNPFFIYSHFFSGTHSPYQSYGQDTIKLIKEGKVNEVMKSYAKNIEFIDKRLGILFDVLRSTKILDNTLVVLLSDHGEYFGRHNQKEFHPLLEHNGTLYQDTLNNICIFSNLGRKHYNDKYFSTSRIFSMICDITGLNKKNPNGCYSMEKVKDEDYENHQPCFSMTRMGRKRAYIEYPWKIIINDVTGNNELYNLEKDPKELNNIMKSTFCSLDTWTYLKEKCDSYLEKTELTENQIAYRYSIHLNQEYVHKVINYLKEKNFIDNTTFWKDRAQTYSKLQWISDEDLAKKVIKLSETNKDKTLLDVGCGDCSFLEKIYGEFSFVGGIDTSLDMVKNKLNKFPIKIGDIREIPFKENSYDIVLARMVFHHVMFDREQAINECYRVLKPGGKLILIESIPPKDKYVPWFQKMLSIKEERVSFTRKELKELVSIGFNKIEQYEHILPEFSLNNWIENGIVKQEQKEEIYKLHKFMPEGMKKDWGYHESKGVKIPMIYINAHYSVTVGTK